MLFFFFFFFQISRFFKDPMYFSRTFKALNFDFQIQGLSRCVRTLYNLPCARRKSWPLILCSMFKTGSFAFCHEGLKATDGTPCALPGHNRAPFLVRVPWAGRNTCVMGKCWRNMATKLRTDRSCETFQVDYNKRKLRCILQKQRKGKK